MAANVWMVQVAVLVLFAVVQVALWYYGRAVATAAAQHGLDAARVADGSAGAGEATAREFLDQTGGLDARSVVVSRGATDVSVRVDGGVDTVVPFFSIPVSVTLSAPVERFVE